VTNGLVEQRSPLVDEAAVPQRAVLILQQNNGTQLISGQLRG
jgi:hypothetical protein